MLTLLLGRDWTANREKILDWITQDVHMERPGRILMVPELISHDTERRLSAAAGDTASRYAQVLSFTRFARRVCDLVGNVECLDKGGRLVAMASAARQLHSRLKAYAALETKPEFLTDLVDAVDEMKRCCISARDLMAASQKTEGSLAQKLEELALLLESYDALCENGKRDPRDQMTWVLEQLEEIDFAGRHVFYIDGFPDFTRQHMAVLTHLIQNSPQVVISLNCDCLGSKLLAFEKAGQTAKELYEIAVRSEIPVEIRYCNERQTPLFSACQSLFQGKTAPDPRLENKLQLRLCNSVYEECQAAAAQVLKLVRSGCRYRDIALVCTDLPGYRDALHLVFGKSGIPVYLSGNEDILQSGVVTTALSALDAVLEGFEKKAVLRYLRSSLSPLDADDCDLLENYAYIWRIDRNQWTQAWTMHPKGLSGKWDEASRAELEKLNDLRSFVMEPLVGLSKGLRQAVSVSQQVTALYDFWEETGFARRISELAEQRDAAGDNRSAQILNQLWEILLTALEQLYDVLGSTQWDSQVFTKLLKLLLSQYDVGTIPPVLDSVAVGPVTAMRCQQQKHLLILGAAEGSLPGYGGSAGLLTDQERVQLRDLGLPLTGGAVEGLQAEFAEIYGCFCGAEETVTLYCSAQPSFVFSRLEKIAAKAEFVRPQPEDAITTSRQAGAYLAALEDEETAQKLGVMEDYLDILFRKSYHLGSIQPETVRALYGKQLNLSASQVDRQAVCRLSYFLQYGLRAQERKEATVDPAEFGSFVHGVLEHTAKTVMELGGFRQVSLEKTLEIAKEYAAVYTREHFGQLDSQRLQYLFRRNTQELEMVVQELWRELSQAQYEPVQFELNFGFDGQMPAIWIPSQSMPAVLRGFVDRVDTWQKSGSTYYRVVDYKTGKKDFDYCDIYNGVGLQMLLYLFALEEGESLLGNRPVPAGVQYFPARAPYVSADGNLSPEEAEAERKKLWKRQGLLLCDEASLNAMDPSEKMDTLCCKRKKDGSLDGDLADRQQLQQLKEYLMQWLSSMVSEIADGKVSANPYSRGSAFDACTFCPYGAVCHKESVAERRNYKTVSAQKFWEDIGKEGAGG